MTISIVGIGTWLPETIRTNDAWPPAFAERLRRGDRTFNDIPPSEDPESAAIVARDLAREADDPFIGAKVRRVADPTMTAPEAEARAGMAALRDAGALPGDVNLLLSYAVVPDDLGAVHPTSVAHLIGAKRATALHVEAACATAITGLDIARAYITAGLASTVLLTQSHLFLRAMSMEHPASPGLGDGASALVVARSDRGFAIRSTFSGTHAEEHESIAWLRGPDARAATPWWQAGSDFTLGSRAPERVKWLMRDTVTYGADTIRDGRGARVDSGGRSRRHRQRSAARFHPGAIAERLGLPRSCAVTTYEAIAHLGACGPVFNLMRARDDDRTAPGTLVAMYGQGAGFTRAAAILEARG